MQGFLAIVKQQEFAQPNAIHEKVQESLAKIKKDLPLIHQSMALYLANGDTQFVLYRPIKVRKKIKKITKYNVLIFIFLFFRIISCTCLQKFNNF